MIEVTNISKAYPLSGGGANLVLDNINLRILRSEKVGILGRNGAGKSTLIRILSGAEKPTRGTVIRTMSLSWPLAFGGAFQGSLTGLDNLRFICRIYGMPFANKIEYVEEFSELGRYLKEPVKTYSSGMRARLAFAISMAIDFDCFLIDEVISVGDSRFHEKCQRELFEKRIAKAFILVSHEAHNIREHCKLFFVLKAGKIHQFANVDEAYGYYQRT